MKNCIYTVAIGNNPIYNHCLKSIADYADKINADLIVDEKEKIKGYPQLNKLNILDYINKYEKILYLDADILVNSETLNIFEEYNNGNFYAFNEGKHIPERLKSLEQVTKELDKNEWTVGENGMMLSELEIENYYNTGVMLFDKKHKKLFKKFDIDLFIKNKNIQHYYEQTYLNYLLQKLNIKVKDIGSEWNRMSHLGFKDRLNANFIHYAGNGYTNGNKQATENLVERDYKTLYNQQKLSEETNKNKLARIINIDGGIGRNICAIPAIEKLAKNEKVIVIASHPEVFENNPNIERIYPSYNKYLWEDVISKGIYEQPEPYKYSKYYQNNCHLIEAFNDLLSSGGCFEKPSIYLTDQEIDFAKDYINKIKKSDKVVLYQPFGASVNFKKVNPIQNIIPEGLSKDDPLYQSLQLVNNMEVMETKDDTYRSLSYKVALQIAENCKHTMIYMGDIDFQANIEKPKFNLRQWISVISQVDYIVAIDSCAQHIGYAFDKKGVILWGGTSIKNLGYDKYINIYREGYPKVYTPYRFKFNDKSNQGAMNFSQNEVNNIINKINNLK